MYEDSSMSSNNQSICLDCYTDEEILDQLREYVFPSTIEWIFIVAHLVVFIVGLVGNVLVCTAVCRNNSMRTVTNYFIVNLAVADFMVILFCLPPTVVWDVTETWFFGDALCKIILYLQTVSVAVSVLTLTGISVERWYAICYPLKFKATTPRAKRVIFIIWIIALLFDTPELLVLHTVAREHDFNVTSVYLTQCEASWSSEYEMILVIARALVLYIIPLGFMTLAYYKIVCVLWSPVQIPSAPREVLSTRNGRNRTNNGQETSQFLTPMNRGQSISQRNAIFSQLKSRRNAAKMLVAVVIVFALCYFPVHLFSIIGLIMNLQQTEILGAIAMTCHWLTYANSAVNPIIYNFMSGKFRREFARAFKCFSEKRLYVPAASRVYSCNNRNTQDQVQRV